MKATHSLNQEVSFNEHILPKYDQAEEPNAKGNNNKMEMKGTRKKERERK